MNKFFGDYSNILPESDTAVGLSLHHNGIVYKTRDAFGLFDMLYVTLISSFSEAGDWLTFTPGHLVNNTDFSAIAYRSELNSLYGTEAFSHYTEATGEASNNFPIDSYRKCCDDILRKGSLDSACRGLDGSFQTYYPLHALRDEAVGYIQPSSEGPFYDRDHVYISGKTTLDLQYEVQQWHTFITALRDSLKEHMYDKSGTTCLYRQDFRSGMTPDIGDSIGYSRSGDLYVIDRSNLISKYITNQLPVEAKCLPVTKDPSIYTTLVSDPLSKPNQYWSDDYPWEIDSNESVLDILNGFSEEYHSYFWNNETYPENQYMVCHYAEIVSVDKSGMYTLSFWYKHNIGRVLVYNQNGDGILDHADLNGNTDVWKRYSTKVYIDKSLTKIHIKFYANNLKHDWDAQVADLRLDNASGVYGASITGDFPLETSLTKTTNLPDLTDDFNIAMCYLSLQDDQEEYTIFDIKDTGGSSLLKLSVTNKNYMQLSVDGIPLGNLIFNSGELDVSNIISVSAKSVSPGVSRYVLGCNNTVVSYKYARQPSSDTPSIMEILKGYEGGLAYMHISQNFINHFALPEVI